MDGESQLEEFRADNHFVPRMLLKRFASPDNKIFRYRILVQHESEPLWQSCSLRSSATVKHLYTDVDAEGNTHDTLERWLDNEFESPADTPLTKITSDARLSKDDWERVFRFVFLQHMRTLRHFAERCKDWPVSTPPLIQSTVADVEQKIRSGQTDVPDDEPERLEGRVRFPMHVIRGQSDDGVNVPLRVEISGGRQLWLWEIEQAMLNTLRKLPRHKWTVLVAPLGHSWVLTDDPVVRLITDKRGGYSFGGGWGAPGTQIFMPISPKHLLYCMTGKKPPARGTELTIEQANIFQRFIALQAFRTIFALQPAKQIEQLRPRHVSEDAFKSEERQLLELHDHHTQALEPHLGEGDVLLSSRIK